MRVAVSPTATPMRRAHYLLSFVLSRMLFLVPEVAALLADQAIFHLQAPVKRVCVPDTPIPFAPVMERAVIPQVEDIVRTVREVLEASA